MTALQFAIKTRGYSATYSLFRRGFIQIGVGEWPTRGMDRWHWSCGPERTASGLAWNWSFHIPQFTFWIYFQLTGRI